jgi:hypothetical protein
MYSMRRNQIHYQPGVQILKLNPPSFNTPRQLTNIRNASVGKGSGKKEEHVSD